MNLLGRRNVLRDVDREVADLAADPRYAEVWELAATVTEPRIWADESLQLSQSVVYSEQIRDAVRATPAGDKVEPIQLPTSYMQQAGDVARRRIITAGARLETMLKSL